MSTIACPSCAKDVSSLAFDCPHCGHPLRKAKRGFFGKLFKWSLILFNVLMVIWLIGYLNQIGNVIGEATSEAARAGTAVGGTIATTMLLVIWVMGDIILGLFVLLTRPKR